MSRSAGLRFSRGFGICGIIIISEHREEDAVKKTASSFCRVELPADCHLAAAAAVVSATTVAVVRSAEATAATAAEQDQDDDDDPGTAIVTTTTHGRAPPFFYTPILWQSPKCVTDR